MRIPFTKYNLKGFSINRLPGQENELTSSQSFTGISVNTNTALTYTAYWACVRLLSETLASLPLITYKRLSRGKERAIDHPLFKILHDEPNPETDSYTFLETLMLHLVTEGNCYALIDWEDATKIKALWVMRPDRIQVHRDQQTKLVTYSYPNANGTPQTIPSYRVWHIPGLGYDGLTGYSPIRMAMQAIGLGLATEKFGSRLFGNGLNNGAILEHPAHMSDEAQKRFKKAMEDQHSGLDNAHKLMILEEGMKYQKTTIAPEEAQFLETRKFQRNEIATFFHVPPHMIGDLDRATFSNIEQQSLEFAVYTMRPWLVRWEKSINRQLLLPQEKGTYFTEFLMDGLLRGDSTSRAAFYREMYYLGSLSPNEIRERENMNPITDSNGDEYMTQANMIALSQVGKQIPGKIPKL